MCAVIDRAYRFECIDTAEFEFAGNILIPKDNRPSDSFQYSIEMCNRQIVYTLLVCTRALRACFIDFDDAKAYANTLLEGKICPDGT